MAAMVRRKDGEVMMPQPSAPSPKHPFFAAWNDELEEFCFEFEEAIPSLNIGTGDIVFAEEVKPKLGDIVILRVEDDFYFGKFMGRDGFRVVIQEDSKVPVPTIFVPKALLVATLFVENDEPIDCAWADDEAKQTELGEADIDNVLSDIERLSGGDA